MNITLPVFGGIGNILTFIVMQRGSLKEVSTCFYMSVLALADTGKYITEGVSMCFYMSMLALADTGKYITEGVSMCFYMSVLTLADTGKYITERSLNMFLHVCVGSG